MNILDPEALNEHFNELFRQRNLDGMVALYEQDAVIRLPTGEQIAGHDAIRAYLGELLKLDGTLVATGQICIRHNDIALLQAQWQFDGTNDAGEPMQMGGNSSKVARLGADGAWRYIVDA